jgi:hypothetical protein
MLFQGSARTAGRKKNAKTDKTDKKETLWNILTIIEFIGII